MMNQMTLSQMRQGLLAKDFSSTELVHETFRNIEEADKSVHAFLELTEDAALETARVVDDSITMRTFDEMGILAGIPVAYKDNMNLLGTHTTCSSNMLANYVSPYTATCVQRTLDEGAIPIGKLNMDEFAFGSSTETSAFGATCNPWD